MAEKKGMYNHFIRFPNHNVCMGNVLLYTVCLFCLFTLFVLVLHSIGFLIDWSVIHLSNQEIIHVGNLISWNGLHCIIIEIFNDYTSFALSGILMVFLHEIGSAESNGLIFTILPYSILFFVFLSLCLIDWVYPEIPTELCSGVHFDLPL